VPGKLYGLLDLMYRRACIEHGVILNMEHLADHGIEFNLQALLIQYQHKRRRNEVNRRLDALSERIRVLGRKFPSKAMLVEQPPNLEDN